MPKESLSVYLTAVDKMSPVLASITDKTKALDKESQELQQTFEALQKANKGLIARKTELEKKLKDVNETVKNARKSFKELGDEASSDAYKKAQENQRKLRDEIAATSKAMQENQKIYKENIETIRKGGMEEQGTGLGDIAKGLFAGQVGQMLSSSLGGLGQSVLTSAIGMPEASLISDTLSSTISGIAAGSVLGVPGMAVGGLIGAASGLISGGTKIFEAKDDAFKEYYGGLYEDVSGRAGEMVEGGSTLASGRQTDRISFKTLFGDEDAANEYLDSLVDMSNRTPFLYDDLTAMSKTLATYGYNEKNILPLLQTIGDAGAALGMGTADMTAVAQALGRMKSSDKAALEYLNILNDRGIGAVGMLAEAKGVDQGTMYDMISEKKISGSEAVEIITAALKESYSGSMLEQSQTFAGITSTLEGLTQELENAGGEAYNTLRESGKSAMVDAYGGELGDAIKEINAIMGENQARKENLQDQYMREVLDVVLNGRRGELWGTLDASQQGELSDLQEKYAYQMRRYENGDTDAGAELESLYEQAQILGQAYFDNSDEMDRLNDVEKREIEAINKAIAPLEIAHQRLYELNQTMKGLAVKLPSAFGYSSRGEYVTQTRGENSLARGQEENSLLSRGHITERRDLQGNRHAFGLERVPYDEYPALLHEGERVLTASEARSQDTGQAGAAPLQITITGNSFTGTPEEMADQLVEVIVRKIRQARIAAAPR